MRMRVHYTGHVQGVGFRATARSIATAFPVTGWVRNEADGSVLLEVQGSTDAVRGVLAELSGTMRHAIRDEDAAPIPDADGEHAFDIRR